MASTTWSLFGIDTQGADLVLRQIQPWSASGAVVPVGIQSSAAPKTGVVSDLLDATASEVTFSAKDVWSPGFVITMTFGEPVDLWGVRFAGPSDYTWPKRHILGRENQFSQHKRVQWIEGGLSPAPTAPPNFTTPPGVWVDQEVLGSKNWRSAAVSSDGQVMLLGGTREPPWLSKDGGATWASVPAVGSGDWVATAVSGDGKTLIAGAFGGVLWASTDAGLTWVAQASLGAAYWAAAAASADGSTLVCSVWGGGVYRSNDSGGTWSNQVALGSKNWRSVAISLDGQVLLAGGSGEPPWLSKDGGATWTPVPAVGSGDWAAASVSGDGHTLAVGAYGDMLWLSKDAGDTWVQMALGRGNWWRVVVSEDGGVLLSTVFGGYVYLSVDGGGEWVRQDVLPNREWRAAALSSNGLVMLAAATAEKVQLRIDEDPIYLQNEPTHQMVRTQLWLRGINPVAQGIQRIRTQQADKLVDAEFGGRHRIYGTVARKNTPTDVPLVRRVRLHRSRDGTLVRETWSKADGSYEFTEISGRYEYDVIAWDHEMQFRSVVANNLVPEVMP